MILTLIIFRINISLLSSAAFCSSVVQVVSSSWLSYFAFFPFVIGFYLLIWLALGTHSHTHGLAHRHSQELSAIRSAEILLRFSVSEL